LRFEFKFAVAAIIALFHDAFITVGVFSILGKEINAPFVAAVLTIIGYSVNDTIVIFDRIRENMGAMQKETFSRIANVSLNDTLVRSINTSLTTLLAVLAILAFGGKTTKDFALALTVGILAGTYSSIFIASPIWVMWRQKEKGAKAHTARGVQGPSPEMAPSKVIASASAPAQIGKAVRPRGKKGKKAKAAR